MQPGKEKKSFKVSQVFDTLCFRFDILRGCRTVSSLDGKRRNVRISTAWKQLTMDVVLGSALSLMLTYFLSPYGVAYAFAGWRDQTKNSLESLLTWLMGAPAGLKLNRQLAAFLGRLFLYHVYIWVEYLRILEPFIPLVVQVIGLSGFFGLSVMLSCVYDTLNIITLHTNCFYVYAAKMYSLQISALISLARLFRGKKWNDLRMRVDSLSSDVDQLGLGTIIFTILLFLLPTTMLYYIVFVSLRLVTYHIRWIIVCLVNVLNSTIPFDLLQILIRGTDDTEGRVEIELDWTPSQNEEKISLNSKDCRNSEIRLLDHCMLKVRRTKVSAFGDVVSNVKEIFGSYSLKYVLMSVLNGRILEL